MKSNSKNDFNKAWSHCLAFGIFFAFLVTCHTTTEDVQSGVFKQRKICGVKQRLTDGCLQLVSSSPVSRLRCATWCQQNNTACLGIVMNHTGNCYFHYHCDNLQISATCGGDDAFFTGYDRQIPFLSPCLNGGQWMENSKLCLCGPYTSGNLCEITPQSCEDLRSWGLPHGIHYVNMNVFGNPIVTKVKCELGSKFVYTHVSYNNGTSNYNVTFQEYKDGFYKGDSAFWLGLDNLNRITERGIRDFVIIILINGIEVKKIYHGFEVDDQSDNYEVEFVSWTNVGNTLGASIGRCLSYERPFSARDRDLDREPHVNIASETGTGWWFDKTSDRFCNLNGIRPVDASSKMNYVSVEFIDLSLSGYGNEFMSTTLYLQQTFP